MFNGTGQKAISLYENALGAKAEHVMHYGDVPGMEVPADGKKFILHALLRIGGNVLMLSDTTPDKPIAEGSNVQVALDHSDVEEMSKAFDALSDGGQVISPIVDTFWGARFGALIDAAGINWMFNCEIKKPQA